MKAKEIKKCVICGKEFEPKRKDQKNCSPACSEESRRKRAVFLAREYYKNHRQHCLEVRHNYYLNNKEKISKYKAEWYRCRKAEKTNENY